LITAFARAISAVSGWRRAGLALGFGAVGALAMPPVYAFPLLVVALTGLIWLIDGAGGAKRPKLAAFAAGWLFGFGHFAAGLYWITNALLVDATRHGWLAPFAVGGLSLFFALFPAVAALIAVFARPGPGRILVFAAAFSATEVVRGVLFTGFPWNLMATALAFSPTLMQGAALFGAYGLGLVVILIAVAPAAAWPGGNGQGHSRLALAGALALAGLVVVGGFVRLGMAPPPGAVPETPGVQLRIVQANIDQRLKWRPDLRRKHLLTYLRLSRAPGPSPTVLIWPETALPFTVGTADVAAERWLRDAAPPGGTLMTGAVRTEFAADGKRKIWNSVFAVDAQGIKGVYDKHHLVPFGEYVPLRRFNPFPKVTAGRVDFTAGRGPRTLNLPGLPPVSPLVCYETIFPGAVIAPGTPRPKWLLNLTNDAWFGRSTGPFQHFAAARLRAVEEGVPVVRAANTGISAVVDAYGRVRARLDLGVKGVIDETLPPAAALTPFARTGNLIYGVFVALVLIAGLWMHRHPISTSRPVE
jgi:apolipoprotein N-acyltransferase